MRSLLGIQMLAEAANQERRELPFSTEGFDMTDEERETLAGASAEQMPPELRGMSRTDLMHYAKQYLKHLQAARANYRKMSAAFQWLLAHGLITREQISDDEQ